ncbi:hypothetical protein NMG60_11034814 [Bertholletia excelsa]
MPAKRSRVFRSSSSGDTDLMSLPVGSADGWRATHPPPRPTGNTTKATKPSVADMSMESQSRILTLSSPVKESVDASAEELIGDFLDKCYYCKRKIRENAEVFMYSYFRAFCTAECRDKQMSIDTEMEKAFSKSKASQVGPMG